MEYTYTIFDADPSDSGHCAWPDASEIEVEGDDAESVAAEALAAAARVARRLPDYGPDDRLWCLVWDADGLIVAKMDRRVGA